MDFCADEVKFLRNSRTGWPRTPDLLNLADLVNLDSVEIQDFRDLLNFENLANRPFSVSLYGYETILK